MASRWKVLLCGYYGMGNLGDELLLASCIELLDKIGISREQIAILSGSTELTEKCYNIISVDRWNLKEVFRAARNSRTLLLGGGGIFQDSTSVKSVLYYWLIVRIARLCGCRVWAFGQSVGPLKSPLSRVLSRNAFSCCDYIGVRDKHSEAFLGKSAHLTDDLALSLPIVHEDVVRDCLLVNFRRTPSGIENAAVEDVLQIQRTSGFKTVGVAMSRDDAEFMKELHCAGKMRMDEIILPEESTISEVFSRGRSAFGMRLHFGVWALKHGVPCTLVPYDPKVSDFAHRWGCSLWCPGDVSALFEWKNASDLKRAVSEIEDRFAEAAGAVGLIQKQIAM